MRTPKTSPAPGTDDKNQKAHVHMLNSTLTATERTLCCVLENHQVGGEGGAPAAALGRARVACVSVFNAHVRAFANACMHARTRRTQTPDGVRVPEVLRPFMLGIDFIPFRKTIDSKGKLVDIKAPAKADK